MEGASLWLIIGIIGVGGATVFWRFALGGGAGHGRAGVASRRRPARGEGGSSGGGDGGFPPVGPGRLVGREAVACATPAGTGQPQPRARRSSGGPSAAGGWRKESGDDGRGLGGRVKQAAPGGDDVNPAHLPREGYLVVPVDIEGGRRRRGRRRPRRAGTARRRRSGWVASRRRSGPTGPGRRAVAHGAADPALPGRRRVAIDAQLRSERLADGGEGGRPGALEGLRAGGFRAGPGGDPGR